MDRRDPNVQDETKKKELQEVRAMAPRQQVLNEFG